MAKIISQETYDDVMKENIVEFSMSVEEAREETIKQFEAQGINLANIIKDLNVNEETGVPCMNEAVERLKTWKTLQGAELCDVLKTATSEMNKSVAHKVLASKLSILVSLLEIVEEETNFEVVKCTILAANALTNQNPDVFNERCVHAIQSLLNTQKDETIICDSLRWLQKACVLHETNRQMIMSDCILSQNLLPLLENENGQIVREVCNCLRFLVLDDDVRVEFGKAHDHAKEIATAALPVLTELLKTFRTNQNVVSELLLTIASVMVRNEFCEVVEDAGGLKYTLDAMVEYPESLKVNREALKLLKALAGNDKVKVNIIRNGAATVIMTTLNKFKANDTIAKAALACISALALRLKDNSVALFEAGGAETIVDTMKLHTTNKIVLRNAAWAIRNMVSRSKEQCETFVLNGVEDILNAAMKDHPQIAQDCKSALRDLGCKVLLNEEWKGKAEKSIAESMV